LVVLGLGVLLFVWDMGRFSGALSERARADFEALPAVDLIAVLTGGQGRMKHAFDLLESGQGRALLISGTGASLEDILDANDIQDIPEHVKAQIIMDPHSQRTFDNAREIRSAVKRFGAKSLLVVTSNYHMQRSLQLIKDELAKDPPVDIVLHAYPVNSPNFDPDLWWKTLTGWRLFLSEYFKSWGSQFLSEY
jgi:uncharacterized SAM-binding protein YcdF (DUF218 family)